MKKAILSSVIALFSLGLVSYGHASDWDKAGKALTVIEGLRLITGGKVDFIGTLSGLSKPRTETKYVEYRHYDKPKYYNKPQQKKVWVPDYVWKTEYIPEHKEYSKKYGTIIVKGHYISYKEERGGHWEWKQYSCATQRDCSGYHH